MEYYIYLHIRLDNGNPFYVGKGKDKRCLVKRQRSFHWKNMANKYGYDILILEKNLSEQEAFEKEIYWIKRLGRKELNQGLLVNFSNGGEGSSGRKMSQKNKEAIIISNKKRVASKIQKEKVASLYKGKTGKDHNRSVDIICSGIEYSGYSEASRALGIGISTIHFRVKNKNCKSYYEKTHK